MLFRSFTSAVMVLTLGWVTYAVAADNSSRPLVNYRNDKYGVSIQHPSGWKVKNQSRSLPKDWVGGYWLVLSTEPVAKATSVVNIRHKLEPKDQTPESFAETSTYVKSWERIDINGRPALVTSAGMASSKRVVHRAIILGGRHVWMANLIDTSGKPESESKGLFMRMLQSLTLLEKPSAGAKPTVAGRGR